MNNYHESDWLRVDTKGGVRMPIDIIRTTIQTARKDYECDYQGAVGCDKKIHAATRYVKEVANVRGDIITQRYCATCMEDASEWMREQKGETNESSNS